ncbi:MAG: protein kinase [Deltaproteobacteria bacterium]|nr:protein kinase [Deltaproteobacteria bacterium]
MPSVAFGPYEVLARLATGGAANIFLARQPSDDGLYRLVCVKTLLPERAADPEFVDMFLDEARIASRLTHPTCVRIFDVGFERGTYFQSMEFILGETVWNLLATVARIRVALPAPVVASIIASAAEGLHHAHELVDDDGRPYNLVHRDVSPQNLMVTFDGHTKVLDFGVAKAETGREATVTGIVKGKFSYMSPEQITGGTIDRRSDLYSLGIVLFECLASRRLYRAESPEEIARMMIERSPPRLRDLVPDVHPRLDAIAHKGLARLPEHRFQSAQEMALALRDFLDEVGFKTPRAAIRQLTRERFGDRVEAAREVCEHAALGDYDESRLMSVFKARAVMALDLFPNESGVPKAGMVDIPVLGRAPKSLESKPESKPESKVEPSRRPSTTLQIVGDEARRVQQEAQRARSTYDDATDMAHRPPEPTESESDALPDWESDASTDGSGSLGTDLPLPEVAAALAEALAEKAKPTNARPDVGTEVGPQNNRPATSIRLEEAPPKSAKREDETKPEASRLRRDLGSDPKAKTKQNGEAAFRTIGEEATGEGTETENSGVQLRALESAFLEAFGDDAPQQGAAKSPGSLSENPTAPVPKTQEPSPPRRAGFSVKGQPALGPPSRRVDPPSSEPSGKPQDAWSRPSSPRSPPPGGVIAFKSVLTSDSIRPPTQSTGELAAFGDVATIAAQEVAPILKPLGDEPGKPFVTSDVSAERVTSALDPHSDASGYSLKVVLAAFAFGTIFGGLAASAIWLFMGR